MRRGFLLPKHAQKGSDVSPLAAGSSCPSTQASALARVVLSGYASRLAILLRDSSVLFLCRDQERKLARVHQSYDMYNDIYWWTRSVHVAMSDGTLPLDYGAPLSACILRRFPALWELYTASNDPALWEHHYGEGIACVSDGLAIFLQEVAEVEVYVTAAAIVREWHRFYYTENFLRVETWVARMNANPDLFPPIDFQRRYTPCSEASVRGYFS